MPTAFTVPVLTLFRFPIRMHLLFPVLGVWYVFMTPDYTEAPVLLRVLGFFGILFLSILGHELGHAFVCRRNRLRAHGILIWPMGGLTYHDPGHGARVQLRVSLAGVAVNLLFALLAGVAMAARGGPLPGLPRLTVEADPLLEVWNLNLALFLLNILPGLPFDGGSALEALLWPRFGRARARYVVLGSGLILSVGILIGGISLGQSLLVAYGAWTVYRVGQAWQEFRASGAEDETFLGYDFSEGYTSLEASHPEPDAADLRRDKERERAERDERRRAAAERAEAASSRKRLDRLLDRIAADGISSLSPEERAFLVEESRRLRARGRGRSPTRP